MSTQLSWPLQKNIGIETKRKQYLLFYILWHKKVVIPGTLYLEMMLLAELAFESMDVTRNLCGFQTQAVLASFSLVVNGCITA